MQEECVHEHDGVDTSKDRVTNRTVRIPEQTFICRPLWDPLWEPSRSLVPDRACKLPSHSRLAIAGPGSQGTCSRLFRLRSHHVPGYQRLSLIYTVNTDVFPGLATILVTVRMPKLGKLVNTPVGAVRTSRPGAWHICEHTLGRSGGTVTLTFQSLQFTC